MSLRCQLRSLLVYLINFALDILSHLLLQGRYLTTQFLFSLILNFIQLFQQSLRYLVEINLNSFYFFYHFTLYVLKVFLGLLVILIYYCFCMTNHLIDFIIFLYWLALQIFYLIAQYHIFLVLSDFILVLFRYCLNVELLLFF